MYYVCTLKIRLELCDVITLAHDLTLEVKTELFSLHIAAILPGGVLKAIDVGSHLKKIGLPESAPL